MKAITITKQQLEAALLRWEQDARAGKTLTHDESALLPADEIAAAGARRLWAELCAPAGGGLAVGAKAGPLEHG